MRAPDKGAKVSVQTQLPQENESNRIGHMADRCLSANAPLSWRPVPLTGTSDVGFDYQVQIVDGAHYKDIFRIQLKGSESKDTSADGSFFSVTLDGSTVRYYMRCTEPILLVLCDLSVNPNPVLCTAYYVWIHDEIRRRKAQNPSRLTEAESLNVRIPIANVLSQAFDASSEIARYRTLSQAGVALGQIVESARPDLDADERAAYAERVVGGIAKRSPVLLDAISAANPSYWPEAPRDSIPGRLNEVAEHLNAGNLLAASSALTALESSCEKATPLEKAECLFLRGKALALDSQESDAVPLYQRAYDLAGQAKHLVACVESELRIALAEGRSCDFAAMRGRLTLTDPKVLALKARVVASEGHVDDAIQILDQLPAGHGQSTRAIIAIGNNDWDLTIGLCTQGLKDGVVGNPANALYHLLRARARFHRALNVQEVGQKVTTVPISGPPNLNIAEANLCWQDVEEAVRYFSAASWPENTAFLADVWATLSIFLARDRETLPLMRAAARARPRMIPLQMALETVAFHCGDTDTALEANARCGSSSDVVLRRVSLLHDARNFRECVQLLDEHLESIPADHHLFSFALIAGVLSADELVDAEHSNKFESRLRTVGNDEHLAALSYQRSIRVHGRPTPSDVEQLGKAWTAIQGSKGLGLQYLFALDASKRDEAKKIVEVADVLRRVTLLPAPAELHVAQSYVTIKDWAALLRLGEACTQRFPTLARFIAVQAVAHDKLGDSSLAKRKLQELISQGSDDKLAVNTFVQIAVRSGFTDEAIKVVEQLIGTASDKASKLEHYRLLFELEGSRAPRSRRTEGIAWAIGQLVDQEEEGDEGTFLLLYMTATLAPDYEIRPERISEFQQRLAAFLERFPSSGILKVGRLPENPSLADVEKMLAEIDPDGYARHEHRARLEEMLQRGLLPIPYSWRPQRVLENISDVPSLWQVTKAASAAQTRYHLDMAFAGWKPAARKQVNGRTPLLDLTALLVVNELGLFDALFHVFPKVAVSQATFFELRSLTRPLVLSWGRDLCIQIMTALNSRFENVVCPATPAAEDPDDPEDPRLVSEDIRKLVRGGQFMLYSDDAIFRTYVAVPKQYAPELCTLDLLSLADESGLLSPREIAVAYGKMCAWHIGLVIPDRYLFAAIPDAVLKASSIGDAIDVLRHDPTLSPILNGIWSIAKPYAELHANATRHAASWIENEQNDIDTVTALLGVWFLKAKLHPKLGSSTPLQQLERLIFSVALNISRKVESSSRRLWAVYLRLVEFHFGERMDEGCEREAIAALGHFVGQIEVRQQQERQLPPVVGPFLLTGLTPGTDPAERFSAATVEGRSSVSSSDKPRNSQ